MNTNSFSESKILIVDDQQANVDFLHDFLELQGYKHILTTTDSRTVADLLLEFKPDIILLDLAMPYLSGFDVMDQIKGLIPAEIYLPILVLTADVTIESKRKALQSGACDFLTKPFDLIELQARVNTHLLIRQKNEQISAYATQLEKLVATKDKFFSIIAHDLRNPFVGIQNYIKIISRFKHYEPKEVDSQLQTINAAAQQGYDLLENLLKWSRSQTDSIELNIEKFNLLELVTNCMNLLKTQAYNKEIKLVVDVSDKLFIQSDKDVLNTIFRNLLTNAIKYTPNKGVVTLQAQSENNLLSISISDTGIGIMPDDIPLLFQIDKQLNSRKGTNNEKGSGLGLILCKEFIDKLGGTISVVSEVDKGTTFHIDLKLA